MSRPDHDPARPVGSPGHTPIDAPPSRTQHPGTREVRRLVHVTTVADTLEFLRGQAGYVHAQGAELVFVSSPGPGLDALAAAEGVRAVGIPMSRSITPRADLVSVARLVDLFRTLRPEVVHAHTPKAGLLAMIAARLTRIPVCLYHLHGLRLMTATGLTRILLAAVERTSTGLADEVLAVSESILAEARRQHLISPRKGRVLHHGTVNGVDSALFSPSRVAGPGLATSARLGIPADAPVVGFVGRLVTDKGIRELAEAWARIRVEVPETRLLLVGAEDATDPVPPAVLEALRADERVVLTGQVSDVTPYYGCMDLLVLPSYREGFPQVLLEASACGLATVATDVPGVRSAVLHDRTGRLVPVRDPCALAEAVVELLSDEAERSRLGTAGRAWVERDYLPADLWRVTWEFDRRMLSSSRRRATGAGAPDAPPR